MNWDTTKLNTRSEDFSSSPLTIEKIKKTTLLTNKSNEKCYLVEVKENIIYRNLETGEDDSKKELYTFEITYKGKDQASGANDAFYYLVYHFGKKSDTKIPFRGYRLDGDLVNRIFFLSDASDFSNQQNQDINKIIQEEKKRWDETGYTNEKDLISDNKKIVDSKWEALNKDANGKEWSPGLSEKEFEAERQARKANPELYEGSFYVSEDRFNTPLNSLARQLLQCLKEDLVSELVIITSYRKTTTDGPKVQKFLEQERDLKKNKILRTFGQFPNCKLELTEVKKNTCGKYRPFRWEIIQQNHPDFDIYMDDSTRGILEARDNFSDDKIYVFPDYKCSRHIIGDNIYHVKTTVSDLTDEEFTQAAQEYQQKHSALASRQVKQNQVTKNKESVWKQPYLYLAFGIGICLLGLGVYWMLGKKSLSKK